MGRSRTSLNLNAVSKITSKSDTGYSFKKVNASVSKFYFSPEVKITESFPSVS